MRIRRNNPEEHARLYVAALIFTEPGINGRVLIVDVWGFPRISLKPCLGPSERDYISTAARERYQSLGVFIPYLPGTKTNFYHNEIMKEVLVISLWYIGAG